MPLTRKERVFPAGEGPLQIGCHVNASGDFNQFLRGRIDEVRIQPGAATPARLLDFPYAPASTDDDAAGAPAAGFPFAV